MGGCFSKDSEPNEKQAIVHAHCQNEINNLKAQITNLERNNHQPEVHQPCNNEILRYQREIADLKQQLAAQQRYREEIARYQRDIAELQQRSKEFHVRNEELQQRSQEFQVRNEDLQQRNEELRKELAQRKVEGTVAITAPTFSSPAPSYSSPAYSSPAPSYSSPAYSSPAPSYSSPAYSSPPPTFSAPVISPPATVSRPPSPPINVPIFFLKNTADLPDILELLNNDESNYNPKLAFNLVNPASANEGSKELAIVFSICATDRVDVTDRELVDSVKQENGYKNVLLVVLRRGNDPSKFKANQDNMMDSGVDGQRAIIQFVYFKGLVLMDAEANTSNMALFFSLVKRAY